MRATWIGGQIAALSTALIVGAPLALGTAYAARSGQHGASNGHTGAAAHTNARAIQAGMMQWSGKRDRFHSASSERSIARYGRVGGGLQCVPFARENSGIELSGNASAWWTNAEGVYERGARPEVGSVLNFRANGRMHMGHVAVVANVINGRNIEIDHANWSGPGGGRGSVTRNITVVDVSERNDWSAVRVALGHTGEFGSIYPTYGFIYDRPDHGTLVANAGIAPAPVLNAPPRDLRSAADRYAASTVAQEVEEVAEASEDMPVFTPRSRRGSLATYSRHAHSLNERFASRASARPGNRAGGSRAGIVQVHVHGGPAFSRPASATAHRRHF